MRRTNEQKAETRQHIVDAAGRLFRQHGIDAVGVDAIMHAAGLTHGGFYGHFPSKEALVAEVAAASLARAAARWQRIAREDPAEVALDRIVGSYLDPAHVADLERGCVLTTLGPEVARRPEARPAIAASVREMADALGRCMPAVNNVQASGTLSTNAQAPGALSADAQALGALSTMVGAVVLARLADSPDLAEAVLSAARAQITSHA